MKTMIKNALSVVCCLAAGFVSACGDDSGQKVENQQNQPEQQGQQNVIVENTADLCSDRLDNDGDGAVDCNDSGCQDFAFCGDAEEGKENTLATCIDEVDNDGDGAFDCEDTECKAFGICQESQAENTLSACQDGKDNDKDTLIDCNDPECQAFNVCNPGSNPGSQTEEKKTENSPNDCLDGEDNDGDGKVDCCDEGCKLFAFCANQCADDLPVVEEPTESTIEECTDNKDNDGDGKIDCLDSGCKILEICAPYVGVSENTRELCSDGLDNDYSGEADCDDPNCRLFCRNGGATGENTVELCTDGLDNDGDGKKDCDDPECAEYDVCLEGYPKNDPSKDECPDDPYKFKDDPEGKCGCGKTLVGEDCYTNIVTPDDLKTLMTGNGKLLIKRDLDFGSSNTIQIPATNFGGTLDGNHKRITGVFNIKSTACSLFSVPVKTSVFRNIDLAITINCDHVSGQAANVLAGGLFTSFGGTASNITGSSKIFIEEEKNTTTTCSTSGGASTSCSSSTTYADLNKYVGGLFGLIRGSAKVSDIDVVGNVSAQFRNGNIKVTGKQYRIGVGGVAGATESGASVSNVHANTFITVQRADSDYSLQSMFTYIGGIIGQSAVALNNVHNEGTIRFDPIEYDNSTGTFIGGVVGQGVAVTNSSFGGRIVMENKIADYSRNYSSFDYGTNVGGIAGRIVDSLQKGIDHCQTNAYIDVPLYNNFIGGIVGFLDSRKNNVYVRNSISNIDLVLRRLERTSENYGYYGGIAGYSYRDHGDYSRTGYITNNSARTNYIQEENCIYKPSSQYQYLYYSLAGISGNYGENHGGLLVNNFVSDKITCPTGTCYYTPNAVGGNHVYESYWNGELLGNASGAKWYEDASAEPYTFNAEGIPVTRNSKTVLGLLRYNSGHDGGVLSTNIPGDGTYLDWTTIVDSDGHVIPVPVDENVPVD